ncbi:MAG: hypothetical protein EPN86_02985 [Nanoarchaeota archaeon]|nr:MAG: hypothetical protein EPN86_02985 [Nanoarchaeota archaeon]
MKNNLIVVFALSLLLVGCIPFLGGGNPPPIKVDFNSVHTGAQGIVITFAPDRPQSDYVIVPSGNDITVIIGLENKGAWDIPPGKGVLAINYDKTYMDFTQNSQDFGSDTLQGRSLVRALGDKTRLEFDGKIKPLEEIKKDTVINAVTCYEYGTEYIFDVCIDTDPTNTKPVTKACDLTQNKKKYNSLSGQGAPVAITSLDQAIKIKDNKKMDIDFIIKVRNVGNGKVYDIAATPDKLCRQGGGLEEADKVIITADLAGQLLKCETNEDGTMFVRQGLDGVIDCRVVDYIDTNVDSFISKLKVTLNYDYVDTNGKNIILRKAGARG